MALPLIPVLVVGGVGASLALGPDQHQVPGAISHPDLAPPVPETRLPPMPRPPTTPQTVRPGGNPPPADPAVTVIESGVGTVEGVAKEAVVGAAIAAGGAVLAGAGVGGAAAAAGASVSAAAGAASATASAAAGTAAAIAPVAAVATVVVGVAGALYDMFGGDMSNLLPTNAADLSDAQMKQLHDLLAAGKDPGDALAIVEGRTGAKQILDPEGNYVAVGRAAAQSSTATAQQPQMTAQQARQLGISSVGLLGRAKAAGLDESI
jgi:hypothetical protein